MDKKQTDKDVTSRDEEEAMKLTVVELNDKVNDDVNYTQMPTPPDGGYGWVIVLASFVCNCIVDGIVYSFGVFINEFSQSFGVGKGTISWAGSLLSGVYMCVGPIVSALANKYGCRAVCIAGSLLGALAFALSTLCTSVPMFFLTYGVMGGAAFGLIYLPAIVFVGYYFEKKRSLATGIAVCGSGFGAFIFAPISNFLLDHFGSWKSANLVLGGIILICFICGALMRPLKWPDNTTVTQMKPINSDPGVHSNLHIDKISNISNLPTIVETKADPSCCNRSLTNLKAEERQRARLNSDSDIGRLRLRKGSEASSSVKTSRGDLDKNVPVLLRKDAFYSGSVQNLKEFQSQRSLTAYRNSVVSLNREKGSSLVIQNNITAEEVEASGGCAAILGSLLDISLLKDPTFMLLAVSNLFGMAALFVPFFYLVDVAKNDNVENPTSLISIIGLTNTVGRIACGYVADFDSINSLFLNNICLCLCAVSLFLVPMCHTFVMYFFASVVFGVGLAGYMSLTSIILVDLLGLDKLTNAFGLLIMFRGTAAIFGAPLIGSIYDLTQSYDASFNAAGFLFALSAFFSFMAPLAAKRRKR